MLSQAVSRGTVMPDGDVAVLVVAPESEGEGRRRAWTDCRKASSCGLRLWPGAFDRGVEDKAAALGSLADLFDSMGLFPDARCPTLKTQ